MRKNVLLSMLAVVGVVALSGCMGQPQAQPNPPMVQKPPRTEPTQKQADTDQPAPAESQTPQPANDLPTAIDETDKDLEVIDNDLKQIDQLDINENDEELK